jgi:glycosyltransferase involved in cell wall biosynthesis
MRIDKPRIVQNFLFHANVVGTLAAREAGVPHIVTGIRVAERRARGHLALARLVDRWVERHVCVSHGVRDFSQTRGGLPAAKLIVIPNGVDCERFTGCPPVGLETLGIRAPRRLITFIGRLERQKGLAWLLALMPRVFHELPEHDLVLVGTGPDRPTLERQAGQLAIDARVHFVGYRQDVPEILAASEVLVLPSEWEGMPNVVLEAMAARRPVVATDVEGVGEALGPAAADQMVSPRNADAFASQLVAILKNPTLATRLATANRRRVEQFFSFEAMTATYATLYHSLAKSTRDAVD